MKNGIKQKWYRYIIERKIILGLIISTIMIISLFLFFSKVSDNENNINNKVKAYFEIQSNSHKLQSAFQDFQLASHNFIGSTNVEDSIKYYLTVSRLQHELNILKPKINTNPYLLSHFNILFENLNNYFQDINGLHKAKLSSIDIPFRIIKMEDQYNKILFRHLQALNDGVNQINFKQYNNALTDFELNKKLQVLLLITLTLMIVTLLLIIYTDVVKQKKNESEIRFQKNELNAIINAVPALIYAGDTGGNIKLLNNNLNSIKIDDFNIYNQDPKRKFYTQQDWLAKEEYTAIVENKIVLKDIERQFFFKDGSSRWFNISKAPLLDDNKNVVGLVGVVNDITEKINSRESLLTTFKQLQFSNHQKDKLFSVISHDLRSPFIGLLGYIEILSDEYDQISEEEKKNYIETTKVSLKNLLLLIDSILDWARLNLNRYEYKPKLINLNEIVNSVFRSMKIVASNKNISLQSNNINGSKAFADADMVEVIIRNLVANSIKFTNNEGTINISAVEGDQDIKIYVEDNGIGMNPEKIETLFKPNEFRSTLGTNSEKGAGLGLITCKELIEKNNGTISVESKIGVGTKISFTLPKINTN